jgi:hypothetical protein
MLRLVVAIMILIVNSSCKEKPLEVKDLILELKFDKPEIPADGASILGISVKLNPNVTNRSVVLETSAGSFVGTEMEKRVVKEAVMVSGDLIATAKLIAPGSEDSVTITSQVDGKDMYGRFQKIEKILAKAVVPEIIHLKASSFQVYNNFDGETLIEGDLRTKSGGKVSDGYKIVIQDYIEGSNIRVSGRFRNEALVCSNSHVSAIYSPGKIAAGQFVELRVVMYDSEEAVVGEGNSINIYVQEKTM